MFLVFKMCLVAQVITWYYLELNFFRQLFIDLRKGTEKQIKDTYRVNKNSLLYFDPKIMDPINLWLKM